MKKKLLSFILAFLLCVSLVPAALADSDKSIVYDQEGLFDEFDTEIINGKLAELNRIYGVDVAVVTASSLDGKTAEEYADDFYDENDIGQGENKDGILLLISENERVWAISTSGSCIDVFTDDDLDYIAGNLLPYLSDEDWSGAAISFADDCGPCLSAYEPDEGNYSDDTDDDYDYDYTPSVMYFNSVWLIGSLTDDDYDYDYTPSVMYFNSVWLIGSLLVGLIVALIVTLSLKRGMKSVRMKSSAADYLRAGSFTPGRREDLFLYHTVSMTAKPKDDDNDRGGFSSTHVSSSGSTHGGRSGSF